MSKPFKYYFDGEFHRATKEKPGYEPRSRIPKGYHKTLKISCEVEIPNFNLPDGLILFAGRNDAPGRNPTRNLLCFAVARRIKHGQRKGEYEVIVRHGPRVPGGWKNRGRIVCNGTLTPGTYKVELKYRVVGKDASVLFKMTRPDGTNAVIGTGSGKASTLVFDGRRELAAGFGFDPAADAAKAAQIGWVWRDLLVEMN